MATNRVRLQFQAATGIHIYIYIHILFATYVHMKICIYIYTYTYINFHLPPINLLRKLSGHFSLSDFVGAIQVMGGRGEKKHPRSTPRKSTLNEALVNS